MPKALHKKTTPEAAEAAPQAPAAAAKGARNGPRELRLNPLDAAWLLTESRATPNHVGGLLQFKLPDDAPPDFLRQLMHDFRRHRRFAPPWNRRLKHPSLRLNPVPVWVESDDIDLEYHVRHAALPYPGGERELGELIGRLHSTPLDLARPPWEFTLIEGLEGGRFATYTKLHHSMIDGISGVKLLQRAMSTEPERSRHTAPFWESAAEGQRSAEGAAPRRPSGSTPTIAGALDVAAEALRGQVRSLPQLGTAFAKIVGRIGVPGEGLQVPFDSPHSVLNGRVRDKRRFATAQFELERLRLLAEAAGGTINDVVLALCGGALRRFLIDRDALPDKPLTAGIPVSVRPHGDEGTGNAISFIVSTLGTDLDDAAERFAAVRASVRHAKEHVQGLPRAAMQQYTMLLMAPTILTLLSGIGGRTRPMFNITISNVPGPKEPLYWRGAELLAIYPVSIVTHGQALNITCHSYAGRMFFGFTGCHASLPSLQKLALHAESALQELEAVFQAPAEPAAAPPRQASARKSGTRKAPAAKSPAGKAPSRKAAGKAPAAKAPAPRRRATPTNRAA
jgi:diacylglycerol O-acyltransferase / wax synthase